MFNVLCMFISCICIVTIGNMRRVLYIPCYGIAIEQDLDSKAGGWVYRIRENGESINSMYSPLGFLHALKHLEQCTECRKLNQS